MRFKQHFHPGKSAFTFKLKPYPKRNEASLKSSLFKLKKHQTPSRIKHEMNQAGLEL